MFGFDIADSGLTPKRVLKTKLLSCALGVVALS
jgi:hypothetical protein